jgi:hypothetical protein
MIAAIEEYFRTGRMPDGINDTMIILIPKKQSPIFLRDFRPSSLSNVIYMWFPSVW